MKRLLFPLLALALGLSVLGSVGVVRAPRVRVAPDGREESVAAGSVSRVLHAVEARDDRDEREREAVRRHLMLNEAGTYIGEILRQRDSSLARWPDRHEPLSVWVQPTSDVLDWTPAYIDSVRAAFRQWDAVRLPVHFVFVSDSARAEVHVNWIDHFTDPISGRTKWARDDEWWITDANIVLAVHHHQGEVLEEDAMKAMALHEIGHLLGLDHTRDSSAIMAPRVRVRDLSSADRATVRLLYTLPAGAVR